MKDEVWIEAILGMLRPRRDALKARVEQLDQVAEDARRACVKPQQELAKITDAIAALEHAAEWASGIVWDIPY